MSEAAAASLTAPNAPSAHRRRVGSVTLAGARVVLALFLGFSAVAKLVAHASAVESFDRMGWGSGAMYAIGGLELAGALALLIPLLAGVAAIALVGLLAGASVVQLTLLDPPNAVMPALLVVLVVLIARDRRERTRELFALLRGQGRTARPEQS
ncbi:DoxX family protein [Streptomyces sp. NE06-03E]|uniref:DoxX family protein n=2 Tax=Streptomyces TaxID=1883 RepID=A0A652KPA6_9ACTN|nr:MULTISPECIES: DoxX family protein [unclassified Streptomyces]WSS68279.1 DoxX family protein [Streptomyces sp. NBC_01175]WSS75277.1 DoxX family protein [Streptomyces sp. NBC_01174]MDX3058394.1 DoxX family protein [Streptomyces sp. NE06-03E]MDX3327691.1 DoxX family protein [Streptomyces sp. ME02-6979-3A]MDX3432512.1 DoxX family protein [Streptomyces sp. ME01-18a]